MATEAFNAPPLTFPELDAQTVTVPPPEVLEEQASGPWFQRLVMPLMAIMMVTFMIMMVATGLRMISPMMLMMPMGMLMMGLGYVGVGGAGGGSLSGLMITCKNYQLALRERRKLVHQHGRQFHALQSMVFPHPETLLSRIGRRFAPAARGGAAVASMWTVGPESGVPTQQADNDGPEALRPWLTARVGVGLARLYPAVKGVDENQQPVDEQLEPYTASAYRRFLRTQKFVTNCPLGLSLREQPAYAFRGDPDAILALARAMIVSLAYNSSPANLAIGVICDNPSREEWDWLKWLPHAQSRARTDRSGAARLVWRSVSEFANDYIWAGAAHTVIFVDTPDSEVALPEGFSPQDITFVVLRAIGESLTGINGRLRVTASRALSTATKKDFAHADALGVLPARLIAQKMSRYRPPNWDGVTQVETTTEKELNFFEALGITGDLESFDPRPRWRRNAVNSNLEVPIGFRAGANHERTNELVTLDFAEPSIGGTGLHGAIQGITRSGKSFLLNGLVLALCAFFGPEKANLILMDFKGGSTFLGYEVLPHVVANITNLDQEIELVERAYEVIEGEIIRREQIFRQYKAKDIVAYRKLHVEDPANVPPLPDLFIIVDEFREFMVTHKEQGYLGLLTRVGAVGGGLGMHIIPCSQYIDASLLQDMMEHLTFGISLKTQNGSRSKVVLKDTEAAKDLPMGKGAAILRRDTGERLTNLISFNVEAPHVTARTAIDTGKASENGAGKTATLHRFGLANNFTQQSAEPDTVDADDTAQPAGKYEFMRDALLRHLSQFDEVKAFELWKPSLRAPISYADVDIAPATSPRLEFRLGDSDAPRQHRRLPYIIRPEGAHPHIRIVGRSHSGRTTAIEAIIGAAARAYTPAFCSFYLIDYAGVKLGEMEDMPNVGGYARKSDTDKITRIVGEAFRLVNIREREFGTRPGVTSLDQYFASRAQKPVADDPYGHFFLVIDGFPSYVDENQEVKETFTRLLSDGGRLGVHVVISAESQMKIPMKLQEYFGTTIQLAVEDPKTVTGYDAKSKALLMAVPGNQPGRCIDLERALAARIVVPIFEPIKPIADEEGNPVFDPHADYSAAIKHFVTEMQKLHTAPTGEPLRAPRVDPAPDVIDYNIVWDVYDRHRHQLCAHAFGLEPGHSPSAEQFDHWWKTRRAVDKELPIGINTADLSIARLTSFPSPHLLALGDPETGKTSLLRGLINSIVNQFTPEQAQIVILESRYAFLTEQEQLAKRGFLMGYGSDKQSVALAVATVKSEIDRRQPSASQNLTAAMIRDRSWYSGPEVFVLIDGVQTFMASGVAMLDSPLDPLAAIMDTRNDLGLHIYATGPAQGFAAARMSARFYKSIAQTLAPTLLFSGPIAEGTLWPGTGIKFARRKPGQAALKAAESSVLEVIQTAHARPWEDE